VKPVWLLLGIIGLGVWLAVTHDHVYAAPTIEAERERPAAWGAASPDLDDEETPQGVEAQAAAPEADAAGEPRGEVLETQDVASYTYLRLKTAAGEIWAAVPRATVRVHDQVQLQGATLMHDFESKTLKRTFPSIYFGSLAGAGADPYAPGTPLPPGHPRIDAL